MSDNEESASLQKLLDIYRRNLHHLQMQAAAHGGENDAPIHIMNQLNATRESIADLEKKLHPLDATKNPEPIPTTRADQSVISFGRGNDQRGLNINISGDIAGRDIIKGNTASAGVPDLPQFRQLLVQYFSDGELRDLCFDLGIDYDSLPGSGKSDKARELVAYAQRHGVMNDLLVACRRQRPNARWPSSATSEDSATSTQPRQQPEQAVPERETPTLAPPAEVAANQVKLAFEMTDTGVTITWGTPLIGRRVTPFKPPYDDATLPLVIKALDAVQYPDHPLTGPRFTPVEQTTLASLGLWKHDRVPITAHKTVGQALYEALGTDGKGALEAVRNYGITERVTTSYVLQFPEEAVTLAALPWEVLWDRNRAVLLSRGSDVDSCERYLDIEQALPPPLPSGKGLHLLALSPSYNIPDQARQEERAARLGTWDALKSQGLITYDEIGTPLTTRALADYMRNAERRPDIIHYFGHGTYRNGQGYLVFDDGKGGKSLVSAERLAAILGDVRLVVIHACQSAMVEDAGGLLTGVAPALSIVTGSVVAMQLTVRIAAATRFTEIFYDELLRKRRSLQHAVAKGRQTLFFEEDDGASWYVPTLYIRSREQKPVHLVQ